LKGKAGTLSEIGLAREAGRPVVFLDSFDYLRGEFANGHERKRLDEILRKVRRVCPAIDTEGVIRGLTDLLEGGKAPDQTTVPAEAVRMALTGISAATTERTAPSMAFLGLEGRAVRPEVFENELLSLCQ